MRTGPDLTRSLSQDRGAIRQPITWAALLLLVVLMAVGVSCGGDDEGGDGGDGDTDTSTPDQTLEPVRGGQLVYGLSAETDGWNPATNRWGPSAFNVARAVYDPITVIDPDGVAQPYLVEDITANDELTEWTITMREGVTFHNGDPLTPEVMAEFLKGMQLSLLAGFAFDPVDAVVVLNDSQVVVFTNQPWATFPAMLSGQPGYMVHPDVLNGVTGDDGAPIDPIGTGPFVWDEWLRDDHLSVVANPDYWRPGLPYLEEVEFRPIVDPATRRGSLEAGDIDLLHTNASTDLIAMGEDGAGVEDGFRVVFDSSAGDEQHIALNTQTGPATDLEVRQILQLATDREALNEGLYGGFFRVASAPFPPDSFWYTDPGWPAADVDEATRRVEEWEAENGPLAITLKVVATQENLELGQAIQQQWEQVGIDADVESQQEADFANALLLGDFEAIMSQYYNRSDPDEHYHFWDPEQIGDPETLSLNFPRWTNDAVGEALAAGRRTGDVDERKAIYATIWSEWAENVPYLWLYHAEWILMARDDIHGLDTFTYPDGSPAAPVDWGAVFLTDVWKG